MNKPLQKRHQNMVQRIIRTMSGGVKSLNQLKEMLLEDPKVNRQPKMAQGIIQQLLDEPYRYSASKECQLVPVMNGHLTAYEMRTMTIKQP